VTRDEVVQQLFANADARDAWLVLSDLLQQEGNPRGEWLAIELAVEGQPELAERHRAFFEANAAALCGPVLSEVIKARYGAVVWSRGYVSELAYIGDSGLRHQRAVKWLVKAICASPEPLTFLRKATFTKTDLDDPSPLQCFKALRELELSQTSVTKLDWVEYFPSLRKVTLKGCRLDKSELSAARAQWPKVQFG
jgi:hypothetical protein